MPSHETEPAAEFPRKLVAALALSSMLTPLNSTMLSVVLDPIGHEFHAELGLLTQVLVTSYLITSIVMQAPAGKLGDRMGHRRALAFGQGAFLVGSVLAFFAPNFVTLGLARVVMATGGALIVPSASALLRLELPAERRGQAFGAFGASMALSAAIGPILGGFITSHASWRATFLVNLVVLPVAAWLGFGGEQPAKRPAAETDATAAPAAPAAPAAASGLGGFRFDVIGSALLGLSLASLVVATRLEGTWRFIALAAGLALGVAFGLWEQRHPEPVVDLALLTRPVFVAGGMIIALHNLAMYSLLFELPSALGKVLGLSAKNVGPLLGALMIAMVVVSPIAGRLADRLGARLLATIGCTTALAGVGLMLLMPLRGPASVIPGLVLMGLGLGLSASPAQASAMNAAPREASGMGAAVLATMRYLGGVSGVVLLGFVWHGSDVPAVALAEHHHALQIFSLALVGALACAMLLPREAPHAGERR